MSELEFYDGAYTGAQIDSAIAKVVNADTTPAAGSPALITSGAVKNAITNTEKASPFTFSSGLSGTAKVYFSAGAATVYITTNSISLANGGVVGTLATGIRPITTYAFGIIADTNSGKPVNGVVWIKNTGNVYYYGDAISNKSVQIFATYGI